MFCDSWECVGVWFGSGGGAAWVQAVLTGGAFIWSVWITKRTFEHERILARENAEKSLARDVIADKQARLYNAVKARYIITRVEVTMKKISEYLEKRDEMMTNSILRGVRDISQDVLLLRECLMMDLPNMHVMHAVSISIVNAQGCIDYLNVGDAIWDDSEGLFGEFVAETRSQAKAIDKECEEIKSALEKIHAAP